MPKISPPFSDAINAFIIWSRESLKGQEIKNDSSRNRLSGASLLLSVDLSCSCIYLCNINQKSSALTLIRSTLESYYRSLWFAYVASDEQLDRVCQIKKTKTLKELIREVNKCKHPALDGNAIEDKDQALKMLDNFAHGSMDILNLRHSMTFNLLTPEQNKVFDAVLIHACNNIRMCIEHFHRFIMGSEAEAANAAEVGSKLMENLLLEM